MTSNIDLVLKELFGLQRLGIKVGLEHTEELLHLLGYLNIVFASSGFFALCYFLNKYLFQ